MKSTPVSTGIRLMMVAIFSVCLLSSFARAQSTFQGKFDLEEEVCWGDTVLHPGAYSLTIDTHQSPLRVVVRSADAKSAVMKLTMSVSDAEEDGDALVITKEGSCRRVLSLNLARLGVSLAYESQNDREQDWSETAQTQMVRVAIAGK